MRALICVFLLTLASLSAAQSLVGAWKAQSMGSKDGSIQFNKDKTYRLELTFKTDSIVQWGKYEVKDDILTLSPTKGAFTSTTTKATPITMKLTWQGRDRVSAIATRQDRKATEFQLWRKPVKAVKGS